jgi:surface carbohydrate biosynthesis protein
MKIFGRKLRIGDPPSVDVIIFDEENSLFVKKILNPNYHVTVYKMRPHEILIGPKIIFYVLRFVCQLSLSDALVHPYGFLRGIMNQFRSIYLESCLVVMSPKAVVTFIDNHSNFHWISKKCRRFPFIAIQNGLRPRPHPCDTNDYTGYYLQHLFCMGHHEIDLFPKMGYQVENYYPLGSLLASLHFDQKRPIGGEKYDILVVSAWRGNIGYQEDVKESMCSMKIMDQLLAKYIKDRGMKAAVILRSERDSKDWSMPEIGMTEEKYYHQIYGNCIEIIETISVKRNIYPVMQQGNLVVGCMSSSLLEAFGIGKKVLYCNFTGTDWYYQDLPSSIITNNDDYESFSGRIDELHSMSQAEYLQIHQDSMNYYMSTSQDKPTHQAIREKIDQIIENVQVKSYSKS